MNSSSIGAVLLQAERQLKQPSDAPRLDAERILLHILGQTESAWLAAHGDEELTKAQQAEFEKLLAERATGKPLAYILGEWEFYGRTFYVTPDVLVPRPETEELIREALKYIKPGMTVADIGTGSGVIAITLARELATPSSAKGGDSPFVRGSKSDLFSPPYEGGDGPVNRDGVVILATDISLAALEVATKNAQRYEVLERIEFIQEDISNTLKRKVDLIVSNPPYVPSAEPKSHFAKASRDEIETRGLDFEPRIALDGGPDGLDFVRQIQATKIPAVVEGLGGEIFKFNF